MGSETTITAARTRHDSDAWPELPWQAWRSTAMTLHLFSQVLGKLRLAMSPAEPNWGHVQLHVTVSGLTTGPLRYGTRVVEVELDLVRHRMCARESGGTETSFPLTDRSVAAFYADIMTALACLGVRIELNPMPQEIPDPIPFPEDTGHHDYDAAWVRRFHTVLLSVDDAFTRFRAGYRGPHSGVGLFWGSFDLSYSRFSGRPATPPPGSGLLERGSMDTEHWACGFWPGDDANPAPAFFSYPYPAPAGMDSVRVRPEGAGWSGDLKEFVLPYDTVRHEPSPRDAVLAFMDSTFDAVASAGRWPEVAR
ncbi:MAG TPA: DUF5996 family protein [Mycobacteriales bacterium]